MEFFAGIAEGALNNFYHSVPSFPLAFLLGSLGVFLYRRGIRFVTKTFSYCHPNNRHGYDRHGESCQMESIRWYNACPKGPRQERRT